MKYVLANQSGTGQTANVVNVVTSRLILRILIIYLVTNNNFVHSTLIKINHVATNLAQINKLSTEYLCLNNLFLLYNNINSNLCSSKFKQLHQHLKLQLLKQKFQIHHLLFNKFRLVQLKV